MNKTEIIPDNEHAGRRLDLLVSELAGFTRSQVQRLLEKGLITVNGALSKPNYKARQGDNICITSEDRAFELTPEDLPVEILYKDAFLIVVNKPAGLVVYPSAGHDCGTLMNAVAFNAERLASIGGPLRPGVVHRLDKDTSGVMVIALEDNAYYNLIEQFRERTIARRYKALVFGSPKGNEGEISLRIGRSESDRKKMSTKTRRGKDAVTKWQVIERFQSAALISAKLGTGRTHQIRVHFAATGHPVLGDKTYGSKTSIESNRRKIHFPRQMLHAELLGFTHPVTGEYLEFSIPLPKDMKEKLEELRKA